MDRPKTPALVGRAVWSVVGLLVLIGVSAAVGRGVFRGDFARRADPVRQQAFDALRLADPFALERQEELGRFDGRYAANPLTTLLHVVPGGIFLILAPLQFSSRIRSRYIAFHRWSGRFLMLTAVVTTLVGLYFGLRMPYGGMGEVTAITFFGGLFVFSVIRAFIAIRRRQVAIHREWMIRAFAIALGISTVRIVAAVLDVALTPVGFGPADLFALSLWTGWAITLGAGELWIRYTRSRGGSPARVGVPLTSKA